MDSSVTFRLPSGPEIRLVIIHTDRWMASMTLTASFPAGDVEEAQECGLPAMLSVTEKALGDLRDIECDLAHRLSVTD